MTMKKTGLKTWTAAMIAGAAVMLVAVPAFADTTAAGTGERPALGNMVEKLAEDGAISQTTVEAIQKYIEENQPEREEGAAGRGGMLADAVTDGVITQDTADKLEEYMKTKLEESRDGGGSGKGDRGRRTKLWDGMLSEGVITQDEYNSIIAAMPQKKPQAETSE